MLVFEFKAYGKSSQIAAVDEAIRTAQFVRNSCLRYWMDNRKIDKYDLNKYCAVLAKNFPFADELNSQARQASAERAWSAISRFYDNCKKGLVGKKGYPQFQKNCRSVDYKSTGWKLADDRKSIKFTDKKGIGKLKLKGTRDLHFYQITQIKRVRLVKRADGVYVQFCVDVDRKENTEPCGNTIGLDVGLKEYYTDSNGVMVENPKFLRKSEKVLKRSGRRVSRKVKGSKNRGKARQILGKRHLKISRQRRDHAIKLARCVVQSNDLIAYEDLRIKNMVKNHCLAKSINDASWYQFRVCIEYFAKVFEKVTVAVNPQYTSQECSSCGAIVKKTLSTRTHLCKCGCVMDRDFNAARNILSRGLGTVGHTGTFALDASNALGESTSTLAGEILSKQVGS
ncbi:MAG: transposase [Microcoleus sp. PH2017_01_SCD_O_A]|uniref:RNA-guided endonuclease InsQ/TnpB family protein n=1 Tax=unclassified Microcoleus TaxID=2642155 RepID=UPI001DF17BD3|nr:MULTISPECIES: transposase [unclassified Microcoleus]MCC3421995.1 transposase [Microcoleus sp. PH2017_07_MST_O_A]MCC3511274.1 transposase [Microcoleus sp. PH2017_17_BER_D_A]TAE52708.1 MAG: transposase [Oscillatoriales cyanobacterium]MCC3428162.1 transposase [Microcoleus sp. PH2017_01_SCD_O_A]MCC3644967.1 transposase [Microcoleus sp. PH2017_33_LGB_O_A]